ncbi:hypothetical protein KY284_013808 [Solanum tuberosum]|nr:hypothetical protein KY284_013808 [Solanum tuberosum]
MSNEGLCGNPQKHVPTCPNNSKNQSKSKKRRLIWIIVASSVISVIGLASAIVFMLMRCGGTLADGMMVAVKVFNVQMEAALILEYMPNESLDKLLYSRDYCLNIMQRLNIMVDVASALEYLHHGYSVPVIHCDLKPSNVLLDNNMVEHLTDFGIAKLLTKEESIAHTTTFATIGYIAPEYGLELEGLISKRSDIYSFGITLLETFTKKKPSDEMFMGDLSLRSFVHSSLQHELNQIVDTDLLTLDEEKLSQKLQCVSSIMELAMNCTANIPMERMNMSDVVAALKKINQVLSSCYQMT